MPDDTNSVILEIVLGTDEQKRKLLDCLDSRLEGDLSTWETIFMDSMATLARFWNKNTAELRKYIEAIYSKWISAGGIFGTGILALMFKDALKKVLSSVIDKAFASNAAKAVGIRLIEAIVILIGGAAAIVSLSILMDVFTNCALSLIPGINIV